MVKLNLIVAIVAAAGVANASPRDLATSNLNTPAGKMTALAPKTAYQASAFPIRLRLTTPDGTWAGRSGRPPPMERAPTAGLPPATGGRQPPLRRAA